MRKLLFFDLETTGVSTTKDRIVQIATALDIDGKIETKKFLINPTIPIPTEATEVHGITNEMVKNCPTFKQISKSLYEYIKDCDLAGFNSDSFDVPLLSEEFARCEINFPQKEIAFVDVLKLERLLNPNTLSAVYKRYTGLELDAHDALNDVLATVAIYDYQIDSPLYGKIMLDYEDFKSEFTHSAQFTDIICQGDKLRFDIAGKMYQKDGIVYWSFGKNKDCDVRNDSGYSNWFLREDFPTQSKKCLINYLKN